MHKVGHQKHSTAAESSTAKPNNLRADDKNGARSETTCHHTPGVDANEAPAGSSVCAFTRLAANSSYSMLPTSQHQTPAVRLLFCCSLTWQDRQPYQQRMRAKWHAACAVPRRSRPKQGRSPTQPTLQHHCMSGKRLLFNQQSSAACAMLLLACSLTGCAAMPHQSKQASKRARWKLVKQYN